MKSIRLRVFWPRSSQRCSPHCLVAAAGQCAHGMRRTAGDDAHGLENDERRGDRDVQVDRLRYEKANPTIKVKLV